MSDFDRMHQYVKELEKENKMLLNRNAQLKEELKKLKSNSEVSDRGLDQSRLVRQLSDYIELIKPSKPRSALTSHRPTRDHGHELDTSQRPAPTPARHQQQPTPASTQDVDEFVCHKGKDGFLKECKIVGS